MAGPKKLLKIIAQNNLQELKTYLDGLSFEDFIKTLLHKELNWPKSFAKYFWKDYITEYKHKKILFAGEYCVDFLKIYLIYKEYQNIKLLQWISEVNSTALVTAFRIKQSFLNDSYFKSVSFFKTGNDELQRHYRAFEVLREKEISLFTKAKVDKNIDALNPVQWLFVIFIHYELRKRANVQYNEAAHEHEVDHFKLIQTYNVFLSHIIGNAPRGFATKFRPSDIIRECRLLLERKNFLEDVRTYFDTLKNWRLWYEFVHDELDTYCFDLNYDVEITQDSVRFFPKDPIEKAQRIASSIATARFFSNWDNDALDLASEVMKELILKQPKEFLGQVKDLSYLSRTALFSFNLSKAYLLSFFYGIDAIDQRNISVILFLLLGSKTSAESTYGNAIKNIKAENQIDWLLQLVKITFERNNPDKFPLHAFNALDWDNRCREVLGIDIVEKGIHLISLFDPEDSMIGFNRFRPFINLWQKPYLKFGNTIVYVKTILADMDAAILTLECYLNRPSKDSEGKSEVNAQEKRFADLFREYGFKQVYGQFELIEFFKGVKKTIGEIDLLLFEGNELLIIEMKRSKLPLKPSEQRCEQFEVITKATSQLNRLISYVKEHPACLTDICGITEEQVRTAKISGCVFNMYHHMDGTFIVENIFKTSFVSLFHNLKKCRATSKNKVAEFIHNATRPLIPPEAIQIEPGKFEFIIPIS